MINFKDIRDISRLKARLNSLYSKYNRRELVRPDPLQFLYEFKSVRDREVVGIVASSLAFGNVNQINRSISVVLKVLTDGGNSRPSEVVTSWSAARLHGKLKNFRHRWVTGRDMAGLLHGVGGVISKYGSVEKCFKHYMSKDGGRLKAGIDGFIGEVRGKGGNGGGRLLPRVGSTSACKRMNLFLRWMVRRDDVDPGGWKAIGPEKLLYPVDTHIRRVAEELGLTSRKVVSYRMAIEITDAFREISPNDPVKYDFTLTRFGIKDELTFEKIMRELKG